MPANVEGMLAAQSQCVTTTDAGGVVSGLQGRRQRSDTEKDVKILSKHISLKYSSVTKRETVHLREKDLVVNEMTR